MSSKGIMDTDIYGTSNEYGNYVDSIAANDDLDIDDDDEDDDNVIFHSFLFLWTYLYFYFRSTTISSN